MRQSRRRDIVDPRVSGSEFGADIGNGQRIEPIVFVVGRGGAQVLAARRAGAGVGGVGVVCRGVSASFGVFECGAEVGTGRGDVAVPLRGRPAGGRAVVFFKSWQQARSILRAAGQRMERIVFL